MFLFTYASRMALMSSALADELTPCEALYHDRRLADT
jgi:hypothetical protein